MGKSKTYSGFNDKTAENLLLDAGAFFANFKVGTDTFETAIAKLLGATRGGGKFTAKPNIRSIEVDGVKGRAKGLQVIDSWEVSLSANILEINKETLAKGLTATNAVDDSTTEGYSIITAKNYIELEDYIENVTFVGKISGSEKPVIIQIYNALNIDGLTLQTKDKDEAVIALNFVGTYDTKTLDVPPFKIYYPKTL
nr:MAG TPA: major tail protein [Caudoviricetes sp.]